MNTSIAGRLGHFISDNAPTILTAVAVSGVIATAVAAARGAIKAEKLVENAKQQVREDYRLEDDAVVVLGRKDYVKAVWPAYVPAAVAGGTTLAAILGGHSVNKRKQAFLIGAYSLVDNAYKEFQEKTREQIGEKEYVKVVDKIAEDRIVSEGKSYDELVVIGRDRVPCYEVWSGRYFTSDMESIRKAVNDLMLEVIAQGYASHNDFYGLLDIPYNEMGEKMGWSTDHPMEVYFTSVLAEGKPVLAVSYRQDPISEFMRVF